MLKGKYQLLKGYQNNGVTIGFGSYGQVKLAKNIENDQIVAVKIIPKIAKNEILMHLHLLHSNIVKVLDYSIDQQKQITYMIMEYIDSGTLFEKIKMSSITKQEVKKYFGNICQAIAYLHSKSMMHRDIKVMQLLYKPQNILLNKFDEAKLCDFGFAAHLGTRNTLCGTYQYMSPQMIMNKPYDCSIDVWALGILLFEMIAGHAPFRGDKPEVVLEKMKTKIYFNQSFGTFLDYLEKQEIQLIKSILRVTPHKRPSAEQILKHQYFLPYQLTLQKQSSKNSSNTAQSPQKQFQNKIDKKIGKRPLVMKSLAETLDSQRIIQLQTMIMKKGQQETQKSIQKSQKHLSSGNTPNDEQKSIQSPFSIPQKIFKIPSDKKNNKSYTNPFKVQPNQTNKSILTFDKSNMSIISTATNKSFVDSLNKSQKVIRPASNLTKKSTNKVNINEDLKFQKSTEKNVKQLGRFS